IAARGSARRWGGGHAAFSARSLRRLRFKSKPMNGKRARTLLVLFGIPLLAAACTSPSVPSSTTKTIVSRASNEPTTSSEQQFLGVMGSVCHLKTTRVNLGLRGTAPDRVYVFSPFEYG